MEKVVIRENGKTVYRGALPKKWKNAAGLHHSEGDWEFLNTLGIFKLTEVIPEPDSYNHATHKIDGYTDTDLEKETIQTWIVRAKTQDKLDAEAEAKATEYIRLREAEHIPIADQLDMIYWDKVNCTTVWLDYVAEIKKQFPKP